jgi:DNA-binding MurR/RpiR family transcriptional regulator
MTAGTAFARVKDGYDALTPVLRRAARWVADNPGEVCFLSLREQARRAEVTPPTMTRLARALGYASFRDFQGDFRSNATWGAAGFSARARRLQSPTARSTPARQRLAQLQASDVEGLASLNTQDALDGVAARLLRARTTAFLGFRSCHSVALHAHYLHSMLVGRAVLLQDTHGTLLESTAALGTDDALVAIAIAPYSRQTVEAVQLAAGRRVPVIAVTDSDLSPLARVADERLLFGAASSSFFHSLVAGHALIERLMAAVAARGGRRVVQRLQAREALLREAQAYWRNERSTGTP